MPATAATPSAPVSGRGFRRPLLTDIAKQNSSFVQLAEHRPTVPTDGTIPQEVLENVVQNHWELPRAWREYLKLSKQEVAARANVSDRRYSELEIGFARLSPRNRRKIANGLTVQVAQLLA